MNYRDLQNISNLSQEILIEGANEEHNVLNRWPYTSPYLQESTELDEDGWQPPTQKRADRMMKQASKLHRTASEIAEPPKESIRAEIKHRQASRVYQASRRMSDSAKERDNEAKRKEFVKEDLYDIILSHLLDEGYAETLEQAQVIMVNMSEDWRESICEEYDMYEEKKDLPVSRMSKQARRKAFRLGNEINDPESGIGLNVKDDPTAKQLRNMSRVGGKQVKGHIKKGYEQGRLYDPQNAELNWKRNSKG